MINLFVYIKALFIVRFCKKVELIGLFDIFLIVEG